MISPPGYPLDQDRAPALGSGELEVLGQDMLVQLTAHTVGGGLPRSRTVLVLLVAARILAAVEGPHPALAPRRGRRGTALLPVGVEGGWVVDSLSPAYQGGGGARRVEGAPQGGGRAVGAP